MIDGAALRWTRIEWLIAWVMVLSIRAAVLLVSGDRLAEDPDSYRRLGQVWSQTGTFGVVGSVKSRASEESVQEVDEPSEGIQAAEPLTQEPPTQEPPTPDSQSSRVDRSTGEKTVGSAGFLGAGVASPTPVRATAYRPPLYPAFLAVLDRFGWLNPVGIGVANWVLGSLSVLGLAAYVVRRSGRIVAWATLILLTIDPLSLLQSTQAMTETMATTLVLVAAWAYAKGEKTASWGWSITAGIMLGLSVLCRPPLLIWGAALLGWDLSRWMRGWIRRLQGVGDSSEIPARLGSDLEPRVRPGLPLLLGVSLGLLVTLLPWGLRNQWVMGKFFVTTSHGGYTLLLANNHSLYRSMRNDPDPRDWRASHPAFREELDAADPDPVTTPADELRRDARWNQAAKEVIRQDPWGFVSATGMRLRWFWAVAPHLQDTWVDRLIILGVAGFYGSLFALVVWGLIQGGLRDRVWINLGILALVLSSVHAVYWSNPRMRTPLSPWLAWTAASCVRIGSNRERIVREQGAQESLEKK